MLYDFCGVKADRGECGAYQLQLTANALAWGQARLKKVQDDLIDS